MTKAKKILALSDITLGYGFPQFEMLVQSLARHYSSSEALIVEPDAKGKPRLHQISGVKLTRLATRFGPFTHPFHIDYNHQLKRLVDDYRPDILIVNTGAVMPALLLASHKPSFVIYYMLENLQYQKYIGGSDFIQLNRMAGDLIDLVIVPERSRAAFDIKKLNWQDKPFIEMLNVSTDQFSGNLDLKYTECSFVSAGSLAVETNIHYYFDSQIKNYRIDLAGICSNEQISRQIKDAVINSSGNIKYLGNLKGGHLSQLYPKYAYSLVMWAPSNINQIYASPNKFFQSIAAGVPPICAPHPQCVEIIEKYGCGIIMEDWSSDAFVSGLETAVRIFSNKQKYERLFTNCQKAFHGELNWTTQFSKLMDFLP